MTLLNQRCIYDFTAHTVLKNNDKNLHAMKLLTPQCRVFLQKLVISQLIMKFPTFVDPKGSHHVHNLPSDPILSQLNPFHIFKIYFSKNHLLHELSTNSAADINLIFVW